MNERAEDLIILSALGELTAAEQLELDGLAASDPDVAAELAAEVETAAMLMAADPIEAPDSLRASVLDAIADIPQEAAPTEAAPVVSLAAARQRRRLAPILSAAAAVVLLVGGAVVLTSRDDSADDRVAVVVDAEDAVERQFVGQLGGSLLVVHSPSEGAVVINGAGLPQLTDAETYVLWMIRDGLASPAAEFRPDGDGDVSVRFDGVDPTDVVLGLTTEQIGDITTPTEPILATA